MSKDYNHLNKWLPKLCREAGLPLYKLANRTGVSRAVVYNWLSDVNRPSSETMLKVAQVLAEATGQKSEDLYAEGLSQYTPRPVGRRPGTRVGPREVRAKS